VAVCLTLQNDDAEDPGPKGLLEAASLAEENWKDVITLSRNLTVPKRTVMVDTNYLIQVSKEEFESILLDPKYEVSTKSPFKKQMASLFRSLMEGKIDVCFSNFIMREFIGLVPKKRELLEIYKRKITVITPKNNFEPCLMDLSSALNSCMNQSGCGCGDVKDTFSYILAVLAKVSFFVTEDKDLTMVYRYVNLIREKNPEEKNREIQKIKDTYNTLNSTALTDFPAERILRYLFSDIRFLTVPVSLRLLKSSLPQVLDKFDTVIWIMRSVQEIEWLKNLVNELPKDWDNAVLEKAKKRIYDIAQSVGFQGNNSKINEASLKSRIIEQEDKWSLNLTDEDLGYSLDSEFSILQEAFYQEEVKDQREYEDLEEYFTEEKIDKTFRVKCQKCEYEFDLEVTYIGVTSTFQREMGAEKYHEWVGEENCPNCGSEISVEHEVYEYPEFVENDEDTDCTGCDILPEKAPEQPPSTTLDDFM
jgi:predicted nucleic acid-binding protein